MHKSQFRLSRLRKSVSKNDKIKFIISCFTTILVLQIWDHSFNGTSIFIISVGLLALINELRKPW